MINQNSSRQSVYVSSNQTEHLKKVHAPLYESVRELIITNNDPKQTVVIDLGCSELCSSGPLLELGFRIVGMDLDETAIAVAHKYYPAAELYTGSVEDFSITTREPIKVILLLEVLEHLSYKESISVLETLNQRFGKHTLIVSMPLISRFSIPCIVEALKNLMHLRLRSETGLWDRTHQILTNSSGHKKLFEAAGYRTVKDFVTLYGANGALGKWQWKETYNKKKSFAKKLYSLIIEDILPKLIHVITGIPTDLLVRQLAGYQGVYMLDLNK